MDDLHRPTVLRYSALAHPWLVAALLSLATLGHHSAAQADPLAELLERAQVGQREMTAPNAGPSAVSLMWLSKLPLDAQASAALIDRAIVAATREATRFLSALKVTSLKPGLLVNRLNVTHVSIDGRFPLQLEALASALRDPAQQALTREATAATLISYRGDSLKGSEQLKLTCEAALSALEPLEGEGVLVVLEAQTALTKAELRARCGLSSPEEMTGRWARPDVEALDGGTLRLVTRGLSLFGRPELELGPLDEGEARAHFNDFLAHMMATADHQGGHLIKSSAPCARPAHSYEGRCLRLSLHQSAPHSGATGE